MRNFLKSGFVWQFAIGFVIGAIGVVSLQPTESNAAPFATSQQAQR